MNNNFENIEYKNTHEKNRRKKFEDFVDDLEINSAVFTSFYARKISKMEPLENEGFETHIEAAKLRMEKGEWDKAYYYLNFIFFDAFRDSENEEKNKFRNEIIGLMNECLEKMRIEEKT
jgi:hypothetical protein